MIVEVILWWKYETINSPEREDTLQMLRERMREKPGVVEQSDALRD